MEAEGKATALLLDERAVAALVSLSPRTIQTLVSAGEFPEPVRLGLGKRRMKRWRRADVEAWVDGLGDGAGHGQAPLVGSGTD